MLDPNSTGYGLPSFVVNTIWPRSQMEAGLENGSIRETSRIGAGRNGAGDMIENPAADASKARPGSPVSFVQLAAPQPSMLDVRFERFCNKCDFDSDHVVKTTRSVPMYSPLSESSLRWS